MLKFNPNPLFPEQPLFEIGSEAEIPRSARYTLYCDGQKQTVYHTDSFDYAVVVRKTRAAFPVEVQVSEPVERAVIRPVSLGISHGLVGPTLCFPAPGVNLLGIAFGVGV